jgi:hypothetical protein
MTVTGITQVFGVKLSKIKLLEWCVANPDAVYAMGWDTSAANVYLKDGHCLNLNDYIKYLKDPHRDANHPNFCDTDGILFDSLTGGQPSLREVHGLFGDLNLKFGIYVPTHDQQGDVDIANESVIIGIRVGYCILSVNRTINYNERLPFEPDEGIIMRANNSMNKTPYFRLRDTHDEPELFLVQNDCFCCA